jgi:hypothetical protein
MSRRPAANPFVRRRKALASPQPVPADPAVAALAATIHDDYRVGRDSWTGNAAGVRRELDRAGATGLTTAIWVLERSLAGMAWELDFWTREAGLHPEGTLRERYGRLTIMTRPNPFDLPSGFHPRIHLVAAAEALTARPRTDVAGTLTGLLEHWFAYTESSDPVQRLEITVLTTLVICHRMTSVGPPPAFLTRLAGEQVRLRLLERESGLFDLSELARAATRR